MSKTGFAMFLAGATVGAAATWLCLRRYYEQITQEEIDSVKAAFAERKPVIANIAKNEKSNEKQEENQHKADIAKLKPDLVNYAAKLQEEGYTNYTEHMLIGLAHDRIIYLGMTYIERGYITQDEYENLYEYLYKPYEKLGGNGSAKRIMTEVDQLAIHNSTYNA